jgi:hypothetical protein
LEALATSGWFEPDGIRAAEGSTVPDDQSVDPTEAEDSKVGGEQAVLEQPLQGSPSTSTGGMFEPESVGSINQPDPAGDIDQPVSDGGVNDPDPAGAINEPETESSSSDGEETDRVRFLNTMNVTLIYQNSSNYFIVYITQSLRAKLRFSNAFAKMKSRFCKISQRLGSCNRFLQRKFVI